MQTIYTKGANALGRSKTHYEHKRVSFDILTFNNIVKQIERLTRSEIDVNPKDFYPPVRKHRGKSRDLPMVDIDLQNSINEYLHFRLLAGEKLKPSSPLFLTQKGGPYSPNTLQEHMALVLRDWARSKKPALTAGVDH
jgi:hypothetical protein